MVLVLTGGFLNSCSKSDATLPTISFTQAEGVADSQGEYTMRGHIHSDIRLRKVIITKQGAATPFLTDDSTANNKTEYDFTYLITGITTDTYMIVDIYNQDNGKKTVQFLIHP
ncbi:hypothetical protein [Flavobacterium sp.]|uniref:hypothetical protein n=1 Tax=Flavobacterium sp. TaxID=239 RepID=UPI0025FA6265|nr:hypothetical protein [Flavobacterium sp.]